MRVLPADVLAWVIPFTRAELASLGQTVPECADVVVRDREPGPGEEFPARLVVITEAARTWDQLSIDQVDLGVSVLAGTLDNPSDANVLARYVQAVVRDCAGTQPGNPVAAVLASTGPYPVPETQPRARRYSTHTLSTVGSAL